MGPSGTTGNTQESQIQATATATATRSEERLTCGYEDTLEVVDGYGTGDEAFTKKCGRYNSPIYSRSSKESFHATTLCNEIGIRYLALPIP